MLCDTYIHISVSVIRLLVSVHFLDRPSFLHEAAYRILNSHVCKYAINLYKTCEIGTFVHLLLRTNESCMGFELYQLSFFFFFYGL